MIDHKGQVGIVQGRSFYILGVCQMAQSARLIRETLVDAEVPDSQLPGFLVKLGRHRVIELKTTAAGARICVAIPLPRIDPVELCLSLHLLVKRRPIRFVGRLVPIVIGRYIALTQCALRTPQIIDVFLASRHYPARESCPAALDTLGHFTIFVSLLLPGRHAADDCQTRFTVEEDFLNEIVEAVSFSVRLEVEAHVLEKLILPETTSYSSSILPDVIGVGEVGLHIDDEV